MGPFSIANDLTTLAGITTTYKTQMAVMASNALRLCRGKVIEIAVGALTSPATNDCNILYTVHKLSVDGTGTTIAPSVVQPTEGGTPPVAVSVWKGNYTAEGSYSNPIWKRPLNQHSGFHWYAPDDIGLPWPATNGLGLAFTAKCITSDFTGNVLWDVKFVE